MASWGNLIWSSLSQPWSLPSQVARSRHQPSISIPREICSLSMTHGNKIGGGAIEKEQPAQYRQARVKLFGSTGNICWDVGGQVTGSWCDASWKWFLCCRHRGRLSRQACQGMSLLLSLAALSVLVTVPSFGPERWAIPQAPLSSASLISSAPASLYQESAKSELK